MHIDIKKITYDVYCDRINNKIREISLEALGDIWVSLISKSSDLTFFQYVQTWKRKNYRII